MIKKLGIPSLLVLTLPALAALALGADSQRPFVIWDFDHSLINPLGGKYSVFQSAPSWARTYLDASTGAAAHGHTLRITAHREAKGFCGVWFNFYSARENPERYFDASAYRYLSFWIKGEKGGEDFDITLEDDTWRQHEDSNPTRPLSAYFVGGVPSSWREVLIPLGDFKGLDPSKLFNLIFVFGKEGDYRFEVDDIALSNGPDIRVQDRAPKPPFGSQGPATKSGRGIWVWNTAELLDASHAGALDQFFEFCSAQSINEVYLSVDFEKPATESPLHFDLKNPNGYGTFLSRAHQMGMEVEALAGTPEWATRERHAEALAVIDAIVGFNRSSSAASRFDGVHFDVEPYSLVGYADPIFRSELLKEFLEMVEKCKVRARTEGAIEFRCDVPAWFYSNDPVARLELLVEYHGAAKTVGEHLTDLLDRVTIMDYRNEADGAGGVILFGMPSLDYAAAQGKKIQVGVETSLEPDRTIYFVCGLPMAEFQRRLSASRLRGELHTQNYRLATFSDGANVHIGLAAPEKLEDSARADFQKALNSLALSFGASSDPNRFEPDKILAQARRGLRLDPELSDFAPFTINDPVTQRAIVGFTVVRRMAPGITFQGLGRDVFTEEIQSVMEWLSPYSSFGGIAIHHYGSFRELMEGR